MIIRRYERIAARLLLLWAVAFNLFELAPEVTVRVPMLNDGVMHLLLFQRAASALAAGQDPTDPWFAPIALGYPLLHAYQHLPFVLPAIIYQPLRGLISTADFFHWTVYLLLSFFPLSIYWSVRRIGFSRLPASLSAVVASLISTQGLQGFEYNSYVWGGYGLYTQIWGMDLLPLAVACSYRALRFGRGIIAAVVITSATLLSHLVYGYVSVASIVVITFLPALQWPYYPSLGQELRRRVKRLALMLTLDGLITAYFFIPLVLDRLYVNRTVWFPPSYFDSYGYQWVLGTLFRGQLFDHGRFPTLTLLAAAGLGVSIWRWRRPRYRVGAILAVVWLLLYFGRPTWGRLMDVLMPLSGNMILPRLILGAQLGGILLIGPAMALPLSWAVTKRNIAALIAFAAFCAALLFPVYQERIAYLSLNDQWMHQAQTAYQSEQQDLTALIDYLRRQPPGRVYAGLPAQWGGRYTVGGVPVYAILQSAGFDMVGFVYHQESMNADVELIFDDRRAEEYNLFNIRYVVSPRDHIFPAFVKKVKDFGSFRLSMVQTTGYFDLVDSNVTVAGGWKDFFPAASAWLASDEPRVGEHPTVLFGKQSAVDRHIYPLSQITTLIPRGTLPAPPVRGTVLDESVMDNGYAATIDVRRASMLMLKATYMPEWQATVDGHPAPIVMLMPSFVGISIGPGTHHVRLDYRPSTVHNGLLLVSLCTLAALAVARWRKRRRPIAPNMPGKSARVSPDPRSRSGAPAPSRSAVSSRTRMRRGP